MPIYVYKCCKCFHQFELIQSFSDPPTKTCPKCSAPVRKLFFPPALIYKGSGFYATEYGRSKHNGTSDKSDKVEGSSTPKPESTVAKKPADACAAGAAKSVG